MNHNILKRIFKPKNSFTFSGKKMEEIVRKNRNSLKIASSWIDNEAFRNSYYNYGVPDNIKPLLDIDIGDGITYSDLILYYSRHLNKINYLELGVSVGKNFLQMAKGFENASLTGFDIENINPLIHNNFIFLNNETWASKPSSLRTEHSKLSNYYYQSNSISYIAADIWDENSWAKLEGNKFNIIFSDALHDAEALLWEYKMIDKYQLLDNEFLIVWDDLNNGLERSFYKIAESLKEQYNLQDKNVRLIKINGWLGKNEIKHDVGFITNLVQL